MTDMRPDDVMDADIELVVDFLHGRLDDAETKRVRHRLETDNEFLQTAAPLIMGWHAMANPRPRPSGEAERHWEEFTKRANFTHQKRKARKRRLWIATIALIVLASVIIPPGIARYRQLVENRDYVTLTSDGRSWIRLSDGTHVQLSADSRLKALKVKPASGVFRAKLEGTAVFRVPPAIPSAGMLQANRAIVIETPVAEVFTLGGEFTVTATQDSTRVDVPRRQRETIEDFTALSTIVYMNSSQASAPMRLNERERGRVIRGRAPEKLP